MAESACVRCRCVCVLEGRERCARHVSEAAAVEAVHAPWSICRAPVCRPAAAALTQRGDVGLGSRGGRLQLASLPTFRQGGAGDPPGN